MPTVYLGHGAPILVDEIFHIIKTINAAGTTVLLVEQNAFKALSICERAYILSVGEIVKTGAREELLDNQTLIQGYLGQ